MITSEDIKKEVDETGKLINDSKADVNSKFKALWKLITVVLKVVVNTRTNTSLIMTKVGAKPIEPKKKESGKD